MQPEAVLAGKRLNVENARGAAKATIEGATPLSDNAYKLPIFEAVVRRTILAAGNVEGPLRGSVGARFDERETDAYLTQPQCDVRVQLGRGRASLEFLTCDLTTDYVHIDADYTT